MQRIPAVQPRDTVSTPSRIVQKLAGASPLPMHNFDVIVPKFPDGTKTQETYDEIQARQFAGGLGT